MFIDLVFILLSSQAVCAVPYPSEAERHSRFWWTESQKKLDKVLQVLPIGPTVSNAIVFIGDGLGVSVTTAARIYKGHKNRLPYENSPLAFEEMPFTAVMKTHSLDFTTTDSGAASTAMFSGVKAAQGTLGVGSEVPFGDCGAALAHPVKTIAHNALEEGKFVIKEQKMVIILGKWVGLVTTTRVTHATPAALYAHSSNRDWENDAEVSEDGRRLGCKDIARQLIEDSPENKFKVILGGGSANFLPRDLNGRRKDGRNLIADWTAAGQQFVSTKTQLNNIDPNTVTNLLGLFSPSHLPFAYEQLAMKLVDIPTIEEMTNTALNVLQRAPNGYLLLVEGGRIDHALHGVMAKLALEDVLAFEKAVKLAQSTTDPADTLIVVTADHGHGITVGAGYPQRSISVLGKFKHDVMDSFISTDGLPHTVLLFADGDSAITYRDNGASQRRDLTEVDTEDATFKFPAFIPRPSESHTAEDVIIYASGPYAYLFSGVCDNTYVYRALTFAMRGLTVEFVGGTYDGYSGYVADPVIENP